MTVQSFITIKWQGKKLPMTKIFNFFSDHFNLKIQGPFQEPLLKMGHSSGHFQDKIDTEYVCPRTFPGFPRREATARVKAIIAYMPS